MADGRMKVENGSTERVGGRWESEIRSIGGPGKERYERRREQNTGRVSKTGEREGEKERWMGDYCAGKLEGGWGTQAHDDEQYL